MDDINETVIELFDDYFNTIENEYSISNEQIQYLKDKVKKEVSTMLSLNNYNNLNLNF